MKKLLIVFLCLFSVLVQAQLQVQIEPKQISLGERAQLTLSQDDPQSGGVPDLTVLQKDFIILGTERNINYSIINGQAHSENQWIISLQAKRVGTLTIPAIKVGMDESIPASIMVTAGSPIQDQSANSSQQQNVFLVAGVDESKVFVNQQVIYTVKLYNSKRLLDAQYQGPQVADALLIPLGETKRYQTEQNNTRYIVEEQSYAIFPQKSGTLKIKSPSFTALVYDFDSQRVTLQDKTIKLSVSPIPEEYKNKIWLPARQVNLSEHYEYSTQTISQGSTLTRTVTLEAVGVPAQLLPSLHFPQTTAFTVYPEKGKDINKVKQGQLVGRTEIKVTYLFNEAGPVTIPELKLPWFNTQTGKEEVAVLPPRSMEIRPSAVLAPSDTKISSTTLHQDLAKSSSQNTQEFFLSHSDKWAWTLAIIFALAWVLTLGLWAWQRRSRTLSHRRYNAALDQLHMACKESNPERARDAVFIWASRYWPDASLLSLGDLTKLIEDTPLKKQINLLSQALYKREENTSWCGDELWRSVNAFRPTLSKVKRKINSLPPINPF